MSKPSGRPTFEGRKIRPNKDLPSPVDDAQAPQGAGAGAGAGAAAASPHSPTRGARAPQGGGELERLQAAVAEGDAHAAAAQAYRDEPHAGTCARVCIHMYVCLCAYECVAMPPSAHSQH